MNKNASITAALLIGFFTCFVACKPNNSNTKVKGVDGKLPLQAAGEKAQADPQDEAEPEGGEKPSAPQVEKANKDGNSLRIKKVIRPNGTYAIESAFCVEDHLCLELGDIKVDPLGEEIIDFAEGDKLAIQLLLINEKDEEEVIERVFETSVVSKAELLRAKAQEVVMGDLEIAARVSCNRNCYKPVLILDLHNMNDQQRRDGDRPTARLYYELILNKDMKAEVKELSHQTGEEIASLVELQESEDFFNLSEPACAEGSDLPESSSDLKEAISENLGATAGESLL